MSLHQSEHGYLGSMPRAVYAQAPVLMPEKVPGLSRAQTHQRRITHNAAKESGQPNRKFASQWVNKLSRSTSTQLKLLNKPKCYEGGGQSPGCLQLSVYLRGYEVVVLPLHELVQSRLVLCPDLILVPTTRGTGFRHLLLEVSEVTLAPEQ